MLFSRLNSAKLNWVLVLTITTSLLFICTFEKTGYGKEKPKYVLAVHGGGVDVREGKASSRDRKLFKKYMLKLTEALEIGDAILKHGGTSLDAVEATVKFLEDSPLFNAGRGAAFNNEGKNELDAAIMDGKTLNAGSVANVTIIKNPIVAARKVMTESKHVMLCSSGAEKFAKEHGLEIVDPSYFRTDHEWKRYQKLKKEASLETVRTYGTVGAVALDSKGNLAAATSTGGLSNKKYGRIGDSPIIGAGTYANNKTCAISATGIGEFFIRNVIAHDISALMEYADLSLEKAAGEVIMSKLKKQKGYGGVIAIDKDGNVAMPFHLHGMRRGYITSTGRSEVSVY
jgi:beta-aspartyl-peptidase (threonine type)